MLAKKYAQAYLNTVGSSFTMQDRTQLLRALDFLKKNKRAVFLMKFPLLKRDVKMKGYDLFFKRYDLPSSLLQLVDLLIKHNRGIYLMDVLRQIVMLFEKEHDMHLFTVSSSHKLDREQRVQTEKFLAKRVSGTILYTYTVDPDLIAGMRMQSNTLMWEFSIKQQLRAIAQKVQ